MLLVRPRPRASILVAALAGCGPVAPMSTVGTTGASGSTSTSESSSDGTIALPTTGTGAGSEGSASSTTAVSSSGTTAGPDGTSWLPQLDLGETLDCDTYKQDCPQGQKCVVDFGEPWQQICVPLVERPAHLDEPCTVEGPLGGGHDDCDVGLYCWDYDDSGHGKCFAFCTGVPGEGKCPDDMNCAGTGDQFFDVCVRPCDPRGPACPVPGDACLVPNVFAPGEGGFFNCWRQWIDEAHPGEPGSPCDFTLQCGMGTVCLMAEYDAACTSGACCQPVCDTSVPNDCPEPDQTCVAWYPPEFVQPGLETLGACVSP